MANAEQSWTASNYYNPPKDVARLGRRLLTGSFDQLMAQVNANEVLIGLYVNQSGALVATHLHHKERLEEMERAPGLQEEGYFAMYLQDAYQGLDYDPC